MIQQYRPIPTGNRATDEALRQAFDFIYKLKNNVDVTTQNVTNITKLQSISSGGSGTPVISSDILAGTHTFRLLTMPTDSPDLLWAETDRLVVYTSHSVGGAPAWVYAAGVMPATFANRPADLGVNDEGFWFYATDTDQFWRWTGAAWAAVDAVLGRAAMVDVNRVVKVGSAGTVAEAAFADSDVVVGAPNLTHVNQIPKVSAAGTLGESVLADDGTNVTLTRTIVGTVQPTLALQSTGITSKIRLGRVVNLERIDFSLNLSFDGANFNRDDTTKGGALINIVPGGFSVFFAAAGANPAALTQIFFVTAFGATVTGTFKATASITNSALTSGRLVVSSTAGLEADYAGLTWDTTYGLKALTPYGEMWTHNDVGTYSLALTVNVPAKLACFDTATSDKTLNGFTYLTSTLTCVVPGTYLARLSLSAEISTSNHHIHVHVAVNGAMVLNIGSMQNFPIAIPQSIGDFAASGIITLAVNDTVELWVEDMSANSTITVFIANVNLNRIGN